MPVGAKIMAMVGVDSYVIDMEAAAFMRYNCIELSRWILLQWLSMQILQQCCLMQSDKVKLKWLADGQNLLQP